MSVVDLDLFLSLVAEVTEASGPLPASTPVSTFDSLDMLSIAIVVDELGARFSTDEWHAHVASDATLGELYDLVIRLAAERAAG